MCYWKHFHLHQNCIEARMRFWTRSKFPSRAVHCLPSDRFNINLNIDTIIHSSYNIFVAVILMWFNSALSQHNTQRYNAMQSLWVYFKYGFVKIWRSFLNNLNLLQSTEALLHVSHLSPLLERDACDWLWSPQNCCQMQHRATSESLSHGSRCIDSKPLDIIYHITYHKP